MRLERVATVSEFLTVGSFRNGPTVNHEAIDRGYQVLGVPGFATVKTVPFRARRKGA